MMAELEKVEAYIGLGSNIGDREAYLKNALILLDEHPELEVARGSSVYETAPVGYTDQDAFLNMAAAVRTSLSPEELLKYMLEVERRLGRTREIRWGPRTIDLDLLLYGDRSVTTEDLQIPHPRMGERLFVLIPLADIYRGKPLFPNNESLVQRLEKLDGKEGVALWKTTLWQNG